MSIYDKGTKIYPDLNPLAPQKPQAYRLEKLAETEVFFLDEIKAHRRETKKKQQKTKTIKYNHRYRRYRLNYLSSDHWGGLYLSTKFHKVMQEREKYRKLKVNIRNRTKAKVKQIEKEQ